MKLRLLCFYYYSKDDLKEISKELTNLTSNGEIEKAISKSFDAMIKKEDWESEEESTNPETEVFYNVREFQEILRDCKLFKEEYFETINLHGIRVAPNYFGFNRILVFESMLKNPESQEKSAIKDRFKVALYEGFEKNIDNVFKSKEKNIDELYSNIWVIENINKLMETGFNEKPHKAKIADGDISYETYYSDDAWYIFYADEFKIKSMELSDFAFLLTVPPIKPRLDNSTSEMEVKREKWQTDLTELILEMSTTEQLDEKKIKLTNFVTKLSEYFEFDKEMNSKLLQQLFTLETRINRARQAAKEQIHHLISKDMEDYLKDSADRIRDLESRWKESFDKLTAVYNISAQSVNLDIQSATSKTSTTIGDILKKGHTVSNIVIGLIVFQCVIMIADLIGFSTISSFFIGTASALMTAYTSNKII